VLNVFKVETIGDSYMCVTGVPEPDPEHHISMAKFAYQCVKKMDQVTEELDILLGPGTKDLCIRVGMHSGPVTAGVLRGKKSRFQLFGDTGEYLP
jgi:class 3 adenylate cyclase